MLRSFLEMCMTILLAKQGSANDECRDNGRIFGLFED